MSFTCKECLHENEPTALFCLSCGRPLSDGRAVGDLIGREILGTYQLVELLGEGGMSVVYRARHVLTDQEVAVKVLPPELSNQREVKARFIEEARTLARLEHPNIVVLHNFVEAEGYLYLVMQCAEGDTFDDIIERQGKVEPGEAVSVIVEVLRALEYAHEQSVIHRDIKPSNIILRGDGSVKVMDFGIAKFVGSSKLTQTGQTMGTVRYMSPEQVRGKQVDHRTDIYSLGITLYEALTGRTPFDGETHFEIMQKHLTETPSSPSKLITIPKELEQVILKAIAKNPDHRFQTAREFRHAIYGTPLQIPSRKRTISMPLPPVAVEKKTAPPGRSRQSLVSASMIAAVIVLALASAAILWAVFGGQKVRSNAASAPDTSLTRTIESGAAPALNWPKPHSLTRELKWLRTAQFGAPVELEVMAMGGPDPGEIKDIYLKARAAYPRYLKDEGMSFEFVVGPLNLAIVKQAILNNKELWPDVQQGIDYPTRYLAPSATLYVNDSPGFMRTDLIYGFALHFCARIAQLSNERCLDLAEGFERFFREHS
jgi:serine/threonine protein kinase